MLNPLPAVSIAKTRMLLPFRLSSQHVPHPSDPWPDTTNAPPMDGKWGIDPKVVNPSTRDVQQTGTTAWERAARTVRDQTVGASATCGVHHWDVGVVVHLGVGDGRLHCLSERDRERYESGHEGEGKVLHRGGLRGRDRYRGGGGRGACSRGLREGCIYRRVAGPSERVGSREHRGHRERMPRAWREYATEA